MPVGVGRARSPPRRRRARAAGLRDTRQDGGHVAVTGRHVAPGEHDRRASRRGGGGPGRRRRGRGPPSRTRFPPRATEAKQRVTAPARFERRGEGGERERMLAHEHDAAPLGRQGSGDLAPALDALERQDHRHHGSLAGRALARDRAAHQPGEARADREAESGPGVQPARRGVDLREGLEEAGLGFGCDPDPRVVHREPQLDATLVAALELRPDGDLAGGGELHGVADEIEEHLPQPRGVAAYPARDRRGHIRRQPEVVAARVDRDGVEDAFDHGSDVDLVLDEGHLVRLDLREVEDVVEQREERLGGVVQHGRQLALLLVERGGAEQVDRADHAVHRRADLVAHRGQELRLEPGRLERLVAGLGELGLRVLQVADVEVVPEASLVDAVPEHRDVVAQERAAVEEVDLLAG